MEKWKGNKDVTVQKERKKWHFCNYVCVFICLCLHCECVCTVLCVLYLFNMNFINGLKRECATRILLGYTFDTQYNFVIMSWCQSHTQKLTAANKKTLLQIKWMKMVHLNCSHIFIWFLRMCSLAWIDFACIKFSVAPWYLKLCNKCCPFSIWLFLCSFVVAWDSTLFVVLIISHYRLSELEMYITFLVTFIVLDWNPYNSLLSLLHFLSRYPTKGALFHFCTPFWRKPIHFSTNF